MKRNLLSLGLLSIALAACSNGENGLDGKDGKDGASCTITNNEDGTATITCPDGSSFTVKNGEDGKKGDAGSDGGNGKNGQSCKLVENIDGSQAVVCPYDGSSYIVRGNTDNYANYCAQGFYGKNCENECPNCGEHGSCNDGVTGDGSCICKDFWLGQDCDQCDLTKAYGSNCTPYGSVTDQDRNTYRTVIIGGREWMAENLKATKDIYGNAVTCYANTAEDADFVEHYGCLYVWNELATLNEELKAENTNRICPTGWRLPTQDEFNQLLTATGANSSNSSNIRASSWQNGYDSSGFGALPAGGKYDDDNFDSLGSSAYFWTATPDDRQGAYFLFVGSSYAIVFSIIVDDAFSVRCLKDKN